VATDAAAGLMVSPHCGCDACTCCCVSSSCSCCSSCGSISVTAQANFAQNLELPNLELPIGELPALPPGIRITLPPHIFTLPPHLFTPPPTPHRINFTFPPHIFTLPPNIFTRPPTPRFTLPPHIFTLPPHIFTLPPALAPSRFYTLPPVIYATPPPFIYPGELEEQAAVRLSANTNAEAAGNKASLSSDTGLNTNVVFGAPPTTPVKVLNNDFLATPPPALTPVGLGEFAGGIRLRGG
jgi:hypothetical protein